MHGGADAEAGEDVLPRKVVAQVYVVAFLDALDSIEDAVAVLVVRFGNSGSLPFVDEESFEQGQVVGAFLRVDSGNVVYHHMGDCEIRDRGVAQRVVPVKREGIAER